MLPGIPACKPRQWQVESKVKNPFVLGFINTDLDTLLFSKTEQVVVFVWAEKSFALFSFLFVFQCKRRQLVTGTWSRGCLRFLRQQKKKICRHAGRRVFWATFLCMASSSSLLTGNFHDVLFVICRMRTPLWCVIAPSRAKCTFTTCYVVLVQQTLSLKFSNSPLFFVILSQQLAVCWSFCPCKNCFLSFFGTCLWHFCARIENLLERQLFHQEQNSQERWNRDDNEILEPTSAFFLYGTGWWILLWRSAHAWFREW